MKLYFLRHGERGHGELQDTLTEKGIKQAKKTAKYFRDIKIDKIICGDSQRARKTADPMIEVLRCPIEYTSLVNEQSLGELQGKNLREYETARNKSGLSEEDFRPEGGENRRDAYNRALMFVNNLKEVKEENILVISHSGFISNACTIILGREEKENVNFKTYPCALTYFELDKDFHPFNYFIGSTKHLR